MRSESGQLLMIPQQALAQMQAQAQGGMAPRPSTPTNMPLGQVSSWFMILTDNKSVPHFKQSASIQLMKTPVECKNMIFS